ncbi:hypothetical protein HDU76_010950, partial [Blyttiomyces sp. JEL0837]
PSSVDEDHEAGLVGHLDTCMNVGMDEFEEDLESLMMSVSSTTTTTNRQQKQQQQQSIKKQSHRHTFNFTNQSTPTRSSKAPIPSTLQQKNKVTYPILIKTILANMKSTIEADITLYLKSILFGSHQFKPNLVWLVNETHNSTTKKITAGYAALYFSASNGYHDVCKILLEEGNVDVGSFNHLVMCVAARDGWSSVVEVLVGFGGDPEARDGMPERVAKMGEHEKVLKVLEGLKRYSKEEVIS